MSGPRVLTLADYIERNRERLTERFVAEAGKLGSARGLDPFAIIDTFPEYLSTLIKLSREGRRPNSEETKRRLEETHISLRLRQGYTQEEVTTEYVIMGRLITELWEDRPPGEQPASRDLQLLFDELGDGMDQVVATFTGYSVEDRQREKRIVRQLDALAPDTLRDEGALPGRLEPLVELIQQAMHADSAELLLVDEQGRRLEFAVASGADLGWTLQDPVPLEGDSFLASVCRSEEPLVEVPGPATAHGFRTRLALRLWPHGALLGALRLARRKPVLIEPQARRLFETLVEHLSGIIERALLFERIRKAEASRRRIEVRYRLATHAVSDALWDRDLETNTLEWSAGVESLFGYHREELGRDLSWLYDRIHPEDRDRVVQTHATLLEGSGQKWDAEYRFLGPDRGYAFVSEHGVVERDARGAPIRMVGAIKDVSAERAATAALRESEERFRLAVKAANLGTWDFDPVTGAGHWDERSRSLYGFPLNAEVSWDDLVTHIAPEDREVATSQMQRALDPAGTGEYEVEYRVPGHDRQRVRWVRATGRAFFEHGRPARFIGTVKDVTHLRAAQDALERSEREFRTLAESMPQIVFTARPEGRIDYVNQRLAEYLGGPAGEVEDTGWNDTLYPAHRPAAVEAWERARSTGEPYEIEQHLRRHDGVCRWHLTRVVPLRDDLGRLQRWLGTSTDIDDLKRAEVELRQRTEFEQQLIGIVSHDLRNPLNAIRLSAQALLRSDELSDCQARSTARILTSADRAIRLTRDLLDFTRARLGGGIPVEPSPLDFHATVRHVVEEVQLANPERTIELRCVGDGKGAWDGDRLAQVVTNLVSNAVFYSPTGSTIQVETRGEEERVILAVHNEGEPIAPQMMPQLFQPLRRGTYEDTGGRSIGLGLFIVHSIVLAHGGTIEVRSTLEEGTTFTVRLPRGI